jgi:hypothetical protein
MDLGPLAAGSHGGQSKAECVQALMDKLEHVEPAEAFIYYFEKEEVGRPCLMQFSISVLFSLGN